MMSELLWYEEKLPLSEGPAHPVSRRQPAPPGRRVYYEGDSEYAYTMFKTAGARLAPRYGITEADFWTLIADQGGCCPICDVRFGPGGPIMATDHNHNTGEVRGVLCSRCNRALGMFQDSPAQLRQALRYLTQRGSYGPT